MKLSLCIIVGVCSPVLPGLPRPPPVLFPVPPILFPRPIGRGSFSRGQWCLSMATDLFIPLLKSVLDLLAQQRDAATFALQQNVVGRAALDDARLGGCFVFRKQRPQDVVLLHLWRLDRALTILIDDTTPDHTGHVFLTPVDDAAELVLRHLRRLCSLGWA